MLTQSQFQAIVYILLGLLKYSQNTYVQLLTGVQGITVDSIRSWGVIDTLVHVCSLAVWQVREAS